MKIDHIQARQILDSRGNPTVEADVWLENGLYGRAAVPSGASTGEHEAHELRDGEDAYGGMGVLKAVANVEQIIAPVLQGILTDDQFLIDQKMIDLDGSDNKANLGANAILAVSLACAHAAAKARGVMLYQHIADIAGNQDLSLPMPMMNVLNGGRHGSNSADFQEYMIVPIGASSYAQAVQIGAEVFQSLKSLLTANGYSTSVGDEGGFTYPVTDNTEMLTLLNQAVNQAGYLPGKDVAYALDVAASELFADGVYYLKTEDKSLNNLEMIDYLSDLVRRFPLVSIEDGLSQDEWDAWQMLTGRLTDTQIVGDDLLVTNTRRLQQAIDQKAANAILIKPNQIGTLTETLKAIKLAKDNGLNTVISHRSGETEDTTIAHLAVGTGAGQIKTGSLSRTDRTAKHNELMRIETIYSEYKIYNLFIK